MHRQRQQGDITCLNPTRPLNHPQAHTTTKQCPKLICTYMCMYVHICKYVYIHVCICVYIYIYQMDTYTPDEASESPTSTHDNQMVS